MAANRRYTDEEDRIISVYFPKGGSTAVVAEFKRLGLPPRSEGAIDVRWYTVIKPNLGKPAKSSTSKPAKVSTNGELNVWGRKRAALTATGELPPKPPAPPVEKPAARVQQEPAIEDAALGAMDAVAAAETCLAGVKRELALCEESLADLRRLVKQASGA